MKGSASRLAHSSTSWLGIELIGEVPQEFLQIVNSRALGQAGYEEGSLEHELPVLVQVSSDDTFFNQVNDLSGQDLWDPATILEGDIRDRSRPALASVGAHLKLEVLVDVHLKERSLITCQVHKTAGGLLKHDVGQVGLNLHCEFWELDGELKLGVRVVLDLDAKLVLLVVLGGAEGVGEPLVPLLLPAIGGALQRLAVLDRLADRQDIPVATGAVVTHFSLTGNFRAGLARVAHALAPMHTVVSLLLAALSTAVLHEVFNGGKALAPGMALFLTNMAALEREATRLAAVWLTLMAVDALMSLFAADASLGDLLHARRALSQMAGDGALVSTFMHLQARASAGRRDLSTLDGRLDLSDTARTEEGLSRVDFARLAEPNMAEVIALVLATREGLTAGEQTHVSSGGVGPSLLYAAADFLALMTLTLLHFVADSGASEFLEQFLDFLANFLLAEDFILLLFRVILHEARHHPVLLSAAASLFDWLFTDLAVVGMALLLALVKPTR
eukprot:CAMPEP_0170481120 /NCGR_PEP_ID=MMETSP0208-20121228/1687_1 /TAXON_ID=197538 /ORGANISM="Strombidium inclinatum, Strain S3" /LENGTH=502 /DNA_ID=CAMNT_0010753769 /DNA_START=225 /DNA_END=1733 /DNA_ORIENTATION=-